MVAGIIDKALSNRPLHSTLIKSIRVSKFAHPNIDIGLFIKLLQCTHYIVSSFGDAVLMR